MQIDRSTVVCQACGEPAQPAFAFCEACGKPLRGVSAGAPAVAAAQATATPGTDAVLAAVPVCLCGSRAFDASGYCEACGRRAAAVHAPELKALGDSAASASHRGLHHADNQDAVHMALLPGGLALVVADGVSTACHARTAADLACSEALAALREFSGVEPAQRLVLAVQRAHAAVCKLPHDDPQLAEPQTTIVLALAEGAQLWYAWVGDSRLYVVDAAQALQLTVDDSWLNEQLAAGMDPQQAEKDANAHCIMQCLGMREAQPHIHTGSHRLVAGTTVLLCSDGLWNYAQAPTTLAQLVADGAALPPVQCCASMINFANAAGGRDNITVALYQPRLDSTAL